MAAKERERKREKERDTKIERQKKRKREKRKRMSEMCIEKIIGKMQDCKIKRNELQYVNTTYVGIYVGIDPMAKMENFPLQI